MTLSPMNGPKPELMVVMPVYNEEESIRMVVRDWFCELEKRTPDFVMLVIDDGSQDGTRAILAGLEDELGPRLEVLSRENRGHGQSCLQGYRIALERGIPFAFQIDSDGQCDPAYFKAFWESRERYDVIYGKRKREDGVRRILASALLRLVLLACCRTNCLDPNVPYRLMRTRACGPAFQRIPADFFLANVALAVVLKRMKDIRHGTVRIRFRQRHGGEPSVPLGKFAGRALELVGQLRTIRRPQPQGQGNPLS